MKLSGEQSFREKYKNRVFIYLMDNETVRDFVNSYTNRKTKLASCSVLHYMFESFKRDDPSFKIGNFFKLSPVQARKLIWSSVQNYLREEKYRTALNVKSYGSLLYEFAREEEGLSIKWRKKHRIPNVKVREGQTPTHEQIYRLVNCVTHLDTKAVFLLMYSSGLKGEGILNLTINDYKNAKQFRETLREDFNNQLGRTNEPEEIKEINYLIENLLAIIKVTYRIYPKRFTDTTGKTWYPAFISRDCETMIDKYLEEYRCNASNDEPLFTGRLSNKKQGQIQLSKWLKFNIKKFYRLTGELGNTSPSLLRRSFYNRLISGNMKDIFREYLQGHSLGVRKHYLDWDIQKKDIILQYLACNFNELSLDVTKEITSLKENGINKDKKIQQLEEKLRYFESPQFSKDLIAEIKTDSFVTSKLSKPENVITKVIEIGDAKAWRELNKEGYYLVSSDDEHFVLQKEIEE